LYASANTDKNYTSSCFAIFLDKKRGQEEEIPGLIDVKKEVERV